MISVQYYSTYIFESKFYESPRLKLLAFPATSLSFLGSELQPVALEATCSLSLVKEFSELFHFLSAFLRITTLNQTLPLQNISIDELHFYQIPFNRTADGDGYAVLTYTPWSVIFFFMILFVIASIAFSFMVSVFFSRGKKK